MKVSDSVRGGHIAKLTRVYVAHHIKNASTLTAKAAFALDSKRKWVVTGTPFQNRLSELASLFRYLRVYPYCDTGAFTKQISSPWACGQEEEAFQRLKKLLKFVMLRRTGGVLELPPRSDHRVLLRLGKRERQNYNKAKERTIQSLDDIFYSGNPTAAYINVLSKINTLRMICNLGSHASLKHSKDTGSPLSEIPSRETIWNEETAQVALCQFPLFGIPFVCTNCQISIEPASSPAFRRPGRLSPGLAPYVFLTRCLCLWCSACLMESPTDSVPIAYCDCDIPCPSERLSLDSISTASTPLECRPQVSTPKGREYPVKIQALVDDIMLLDDNTKRQDIPASLDVIVSSRLTHRKALYSPSGELLMT